MNTPTKNTRTVMLLTFFFTSRFLFAQASSKVTLEFGSPIMSDSSSTLMIPTLYNTGLFSSNKLGLWGDFYANILFYNFKTDSSKKLFEKDTYIVNFNRLNYSFYPDRKPTKNMTTNLVFCRVMNVDRNKNNKIDSEDPTVLYVSDTDGNNVKALTSDTENVLGFDLYEKQHFALVKIQRDSNNDGAFTAKDTDFYDAKLDLDTLLFGNKIELK